MPDQIGPLTFPWPPAGYDQAAWRLLSGRINAERSGVEMIPQPGAAPFPAGQASSRTLRSSPHMKYWSVLCSWSILVFYVPLLLVLQWSVSLRHLSMGIPSNPSEAFFGPAPFSLAISLRIMHWKPI